MKNYPSSGHGYARLNEEGTVSNNLKSIRSNFNILSLKNVLTVQYLIFS
jgi:hypothetical protein